MVPGFYRWVSWQDRQAWHSMTKKKNIANQAPLRFQRHSSSVSASCMRLMINGKPIRRNSHVPKNRERLACVTDLVTCPQLGTKALARTHRFVFWYLATSS